MNRQQAEKLLAAAIFDELDEDSKAELLAYLQTDDELRAHMADMRMGVKLTRDAANEGPEPVLSAARLKHLERLAKTAKPRAHITLRQAALAIAAVLVFGVLFVVVCLPGLSGSRRGPSIRLTGGTSRFSEMADRAGLESGQVPSAAVTQEAPADSAPARGSGITVLARRPNPADLTERRPVATDDSDAPTVDSYVYGGGMGGYGDGYGADMGGYGNNGSYGAGAQNRSGVVATDGRARGNYDIKFTGGPAVSIDLGDADGLQVARNERAGQTFNANADSGSRAYVSSDDTSSAARTYDRLDTAETSSGLVARGEKGVPNATEEDARKALAAIQDNQIFSNNRSRARAMAPPPTEPAPADGPAAARDIRQGLSGMPDVPAPVLSRSNPTERGARSVPSVVARDTSDLQSMYESGLQSPQQGARSSRGARSTATDRVVSAPVPQLSNEQAARLSQEMQMLERRKEALTQQVAQTAKPSVAPPAAPPATSQPVARSITEGLTLGREYDARRGGEMATASGQPTQGFRAGPQLGDTELRELMEQEQRRPSDEFGGQSGRSGVMDSVSAAGPAQQTPATIGTPQNAQGQGQDRTGRIQAGLFTDSYQVARGLPDSAVDSQVSRELVADEESGVQEHNAALGRNAAGIDNRPATFGSRIGQRPEVLVDGDADEAMKVPAFGDLPMVGSLFKREAEPAKDAEFYVQSEFKAIDPVKEDVANTTLEWSPDVKVYQLKNAQANNVAAVIDEVFGKEAQRARGGRRGPVDGDATSGNVGIVATVDEQTNSVVVTGPPEIMTVINGVIAELDKEPAEVAAEVRPNTQAAQVPSEDAGTLPPESRFKVVPVNPWVMTESDAQSTFALDVDTASYALCRRYIRNGYLPPIGAVRMEEFINAFDYAYPQREAPTFAVYADGAPSPFAPAGRDVTLLKIAVKARTVGRDQRRPAHLVFVVDASASMGQPDRLGAVQSALEMLTDQLSENDRVSLVTCAETARLHMEAVPATQKDTIRRTIAAIQPAGPTNLLAGLELGYAIARRSFAPGQINQVILCSDGVANVGQVEAEAVLEKVAQDRKQAITLTCVGVGYGAYNDSFLEALANRGDGRYVFLDPTPQAQATLVGQLADTLQTVAQDARIQVEFDPACVRRYRLIGYENRDIADESFRDDTIDAGEVGSGQCSTALYELELTNTIDAHSDNLGTVFVRYRDTDTGAFEEISQVLPASLVRRRNVEDDPRFFLAAGAARFAEWLRQSEHARDTKLVDVQNLLDEVSAALPLDSDIKELADLAHTAENLPRAP